MGKSMIRIGNAGGYWGDDTSAFRRQVRGGPIDYVTIDFLAEITMSILQKQKEKDPAAGYARDFIGMARPEMAYMKARGIKVITNAGGVNPRGCAEALLAAARAEGVALTVGVVDGDDLVPRIAELRAAGCDLRDMDDGAAFDPIAGSVVAANAYFGAAAVARALAAGADIVVTGRVTDTGITLAPLLHEFGWAPDDWDRIASGLIAGHIIECGAQATGGNFTDWRNVPDYAHIGYPIVEASPDGTFVVTKHPDTGGLVSIGTVSEQLLYEMGDPNAYLTPDGTADFTSIRLAADGENRVRVSGIRGFPPPPTLKVSMAYRSGHKASGAIIICGPDAVAKARAFADIFWTRFQETVEARFTEFVGHDACHGALAQAVEPNEILLRLSVRDADRKKIDAFSKLLPSLILSGPPGVAVTGGRPPVSEVIAYRPTLIPRSAAIPRVWIADPAGRSESFAVDWPAVAPSAPPRRAAAPDRLPEPALSGQAVSVPLSRLALGRSGDKGDTANVGIIARTPEVYPFLCRTLTAERVKSLFGPLVAGPVTRHEVPNLVALNFLLDRSLGGGGTVSLKIDPQGKTYAQALLRTEFEVDRALLDAVDGVPAAKARTAR